MADFKIIISSNLWQHIIMGGIFKRKKLRVIASFGEVCAKERDATFCARHLSGLANLSLQSSNCKQSAI